MKIHIALLPLALFLPLAACSKSEAGNPSDAAKTAKEASAQVQKVDFSKLAPEELKTKAKATLDDLHAQMVNLKDVPAAKELVAKFQPMLDQLVAAKDKVLAAGLDKANVQKVIDDVTAKLGSNKELMAAVQPLVDKLKALIA
jgi:hypothetical protein